MRKLLRIVRVVVLLLLACSVDHVAAQADWITYRNSDFKFRFIYPSDWMQGTPRGANVRATFFSPKGTPRANCNIVVRIIPELAAETQASLNEEINRRPLNGANWAEMMGGKWPDFRLIETKIVKVDNQPAYYGIVEFTHETLDRKTFMKGMILATFTPGHMWVFSCAAKGNSKAEATQSYAHWEKTFKRILGSLVFERW